MKQTVLRVLRDPLTVAAAAYLLSIAMLFIPTASFGALFFDDLFLAYLFGLGMVRVLMAGVLFALFYGTVRALRPSCSWRALIWSVPALLIAVNNFPLVALAEGSVRVNAPSGVVALFFFHNFGIALFEETAFRGIIFPCLYAKCGRSKLGRLIAVALSAALFSLIHLLNLISGQSFEATLLQLGYTFLIGAMLAIAVERGAGVGACVAAHMLFNCGGDLVGYVASGTLQGVWTLSELVLTAVVGVAVLLFHIALLYKTPPRDACLQGAGFRFAPLGRAELLSCTLRIGRAATASAGNDLAQGVTLQAGDAPAQGGSPQRRSPPDKE